MKKHYQHNRKKGQSRKRRPAPFWMRREEAKFCLDCEAIWKDGSKCPSCGGDVYAYLSNWIPTLKVCRTTEPDHNRSAPVVSATTGEPLPGVLRFFRRMVGLPEPGGAA